MFSFGDRETNVVELNDQRPSPERLLDISISTTAPIVHSFIFQSLEAYECSMNSLG